MCPYAKLLLFSKLGVVKLSYFDVFCICLDLVFVAASSKIHSEGVVQCLKTFL